MKVRQTQSVYVLQFSAYCRSVCGYVTSIACVWLLIINVTSIAMVKKNAGYADYSKNKLFADLRYTLLDGCFSNKMHKQY